MKLYKSTPLLILHIMLFSGLLSSCDRSNISIEPATATIEIAGDIYSNSSLDLNNSKNKIFSEVIGQLKAGQSIKILESGKWTTYKIELPDGTMGWISEDCIKPSQLSYIKYKASGNNRHIASNRGAVGEDRIIVKEVNEKTSVTRLEDFREVKNSENIIDWTMVRTDDGVEGWIMSDYLYRVAMDTTRYIHRKKWTYKDESFSSSWIGKPIDRFTTKFKEPSGIRINADRNTYYFNNIYLINLHNESYGIRVYEKDGIIQDIDAGTKKKNLSSYLPLSTLLRSKVVSNRIGNWQYMFESDYSPDRKTIDIREYMPGWLAWIIIIIVLLIMIAILYMVLKIPFIIVNKFSYKKSLNSKLFNRRILLYATTGSVILGYLYCAFMIINIYPFNSIFWISSIVSLGMILGNINKWRNDLDYKRCNAAECHLWTGEHNGTEYLGGTTTTQTITYNDGSRNKNTQTTRRYRDYRKCSSCGNEWSIVRTEVIGNLKI